MNVSHTKPVRAFSTMTIVIPVSIPITSGSYQFVKRIEGIHESVPAPGTVSVAIFHRAQHAHGRIRQKWQ